ncbi:Protein of unknown function DUF72 [Prosthecobacter debontii]|uniref:DUF72 domain-containing protein n=1 Tax=Prosthecobacter debontii TaxID=48467 RepID=A0A1T4WVT0_9BACT|nr:DUF72 domain-containing protein [Prosthecobacter debontii]SKA80975.1 Protein of unknown function DUF72 [Prosthecobacter debontii]
MLTSLSPTFPLVPLKAAVAELAAHGVFVGTSSWKYPGWLGLLYDEQRYIHRGRFSESRFQKDCLEEYAQVFRTVCVDAGYYQFPSPQFINDLCSQVPEGFRFSFKVTDQITTKIFPSLPRHGKRAGQPNPHFLDADLFKQAFLASCAPHRDKIGVLMFEFSHFHSRDFQRGRDFVEALDTFLAQLPKGWQYGVEIRNKTLLHPDYFAVLRKHHVTHVYNNWTRMPTVGEQMDIPDSLTCDEFSTARFLLKPGRTFEQAVEAFKPYTETKEVNVEARASAVRLARKLMVKGKPWPSFLFFNNRLEGNSLFTLLAILHELNLFGLQPAPPKDPIA